MVADELVVPDAEIPQSSAAIGDFGIFGDSP